MAFFTLKISYILLKSHTCYFIYALPVTLSRNSEMLNNITYKSRTILPKQDKNWKW